MRKNAHIAYMGEIDQQLELLARFQQHIFQLIQSEVANAGYFKDSRGIAIIKKILP